MPTLHFEWTLTLGHAVIISMLGIGLRLGHKCYRAVMVWMAEHEVLVSEFCVRNNMSRADFASRAMIVLAAQQKRRANGHTTKGAEA